MRHVRPPALILLLLLCGSLAPGQSPYTYRRDGNWWVSQTREGKVFYVLGFLDGMDLGNRFSYWRTLDKDKDDPNVAKSIDSYAEMGRTYLSNVTTGQLVDGLDTFYGDYRNRRIEVYGAVWLVLNGIAGTPQDKLDKMTESWRKNASK